MFKQTLCAIVAALGIASLSRCTTDVSKFANIGEEEITATHTEYLWGGRSSQNIKVVKPTGTIYFNDCGYMHSNGSLCSEVCADGGAEKKCKSVSDLSPEDKFKAEQEYLTYSNAVDF